MTEVLILPGTVAHVETLHANLRKGDRLELCGLGVDPWTALTETWAESRMTKTAFVGGRLAAMWGCGGSALGGVGVPWLLTTPAVEAVPVTMVKTARAEVGRMLSVWPRLENWVDAGYAQACGFLQVVGFSLGEPRALRTGAVFRPFTMERG